MAGRALETTGVARRIVGILGPPALLGCVIGLVIADRKIDELRFFEFGLHRLLRAELAATLAATLGRTLAICVAAYVVLVLTSRFFSGFHPERIMQRRGWRWLAGAGAVAFAASCLLGLVVVAESLWVKPTGPNVLLVSVDTLRADHLGFYGYARDTSPNLDAFAKQSQVYLHCSAHGAMTGPSTASLLTGFLPHETTVFDNSPLPPSMVTAAEFLRDSGYRTRGIVSNFVLRKKEGYAQGFEAFDGEMDAAGSSAASPREPPETPPTARCERSKSCGATLSSCGSTTRIPTVPTHLRSAWPRCSMLRSRATSSPSMTRSAATAVFLRIRSSSTKKISRSYRDT